MSSKLMLALFVTAVLMTSIAAVTIPAANALTSRNSFNDNHYTALYPGGPRICGDHVCGPGEYGKMQQELAQAQMKGKAGTMPSTTQGNMTQGQNNMSQGHSMLSSSVCQMVNTALTNAMVGPAKITKIMAELGCSQ